MRPLTKGATVVAVAAVSLLLATMALPSGASTPLGQFATLVTAGVTSGTDLNSSPQAITTGPDGLQWYVDHNSVNRINADGTVTRFPVEAQFGFTAILQAITTGPDGNLWFTKFNGPGQIARITPAGVITVMTTFTDGTVQDIIAGPDGNLWYTRPFVDEDGGVLGRITPTGVVTEFAPPNDGPQPRALAVGSDGNIWYTDDGGDTGTGDHIGSILKATPGGVITLVAQSGVTAGFGPGFFAPSIVNGPDGNLWAPLVSEGGSAVARITTAGVVTEFADVDTEDLTDITAGCGYLWIGQSNVFEGTPAVWRLTPTGTFTRFATGIPPTASPLGLSFGPDNDVKIAADGPPGRILNLGTGCIVPPPAPPPPIPVPVNPVLTG